MQSACGTVSSGTGAPGTTIVVSGLGFQPQAIIFWTSGRQSAGAGSESSNPSFGWATSPASRHCVASPSQNAAGTSNTRSAMRDDACVAEVNVSTGALIGALDLQSMDVGGFTLVVDVSYSLSREISYLALGDGITVGTEVIQSPAATGIQNYTGLGFEPDLCLFIGTRSTTAPPSQGVDSTRSIGWAAASGQGVCAGGSNDGSGTMVARNYCYNGECIALLNAGANAIERRAQWNGTVPGGYSLNWVEATATQARFAVLAIAGVSASVLGFNTATVVGNFGVVGAGFQPKAMLAMTTAWPFPAADTPNTDDFPIISAVDQAGTQRVHALADYNGVGTSQVYLLYRTTRVFEWADLLGGEASFVSFDPDGFTWNMVVASASPNGVTALLIGDALAPAGPPPGSLSLVGVGA